MGVGVGVGWWVAAKDEINVPIALSAFRDNVVVGGGE